MYSNIKIFITRHKNWVTLTTLFFFLQFKCKLVYIQFRIYRFIVWFANAVLRKSESFTYDWWVPPVVRAPQFIIIYFLFLITFSSTSIHFLVSKWDGNIAMLQYCIFKCVSGPSICTAGPKDF